MWDSTKADLKRKQRHKAPQGPTSIASRSQIALMALVSLICGKVASLSMHVSRVCSCPVAGILVRTDPREKLVYKGNHES